MESPVKVSGKSSLKNEEIEFEIEKWLICMYYQYLVDMIVYKYF